MHILMNLALGYHCFSRKYCDKHQFSNKDKLNCDNTKIHQNCGTKDSFKYFYKNGEAHFN